MVVLRNSAGDVLAGLLLTGCKRRLLYVVDLTSQAERLGSRVGNPATTFKMFSMGGCPVSCDYARIAWDWLKTRLYRSGETPGHPPAIFEE
jgi:hypothetical protein